MKPHTPAATAAARQLTQCRGKAPLESFSLAKSVAARSRRKHGTNMESYRCPHCLHWHVGPLNRNPTRTERDRKRLAHQLEKEIVE